MQQEDKQILWQSSAVLLGAALPAMLLGKAVMFSVLGMGLLSGLMATKGESLRATVKLLFGSWFTALLVVLLAVLLVGVVTGVNPVFAFDKWQQLVLVLFCTALLFIVFREMPGRYLEELLRALSVGAIVMAVFGLLDALLGDPRLSAALHGEDKALTPYRLNYVSSALAVILPFVWARLLLKAREAEPFAVRVAEPVAAFSIVAALVCGGRAGWAGLLAAGLVFALLAGRYHGMVLHKRHYALGAGILLASFLLYGFSFGWDFVIDRVFIVGEADRGRGMLSGRLDVWGTAINHLLDMPLFGIGVMNYRNLPDAVDMHPHNWLLQMLLETGIVGTSLFLILIGMILYRFFHFAKGNVYGVAACASLLAFLTAGLANTSIFNGWWLAYLAFTVLLGWRAGWGGNDLKKRRRGRLLR